ncbi:DNAse I-like superfamily protein [Euphorbia peplus]|nr:DNAse I-like superfamily protein [Euphorbia peplus]
MNIHNPSILVLVETKCSGILADNVIKKIGFDFSHRVEAIGFAGGIWVLWNNPIKISVLASSWQFVHLQVQLLHSDPFLFTAIYGSPNPTRRKWLWDGLSSLAANIKEPWILARDFNAILTSEDKRGGSIRRMRGCPLFQDFMDAAGLHDLGFTGPRFTWKRGLLLERLDRAVGNSVWSDTYPRTTINHLPRIKSDHRPLLLSIGNPISHQFFPKPFRFIRAWLEHPDYQQLVLNAWNQSEGLDLNISNLTDLLKIWNVEVFGNIMKRKKNLLNRLKGLQCAMEFISTPTMIAAEAQILHDLETTLKQEEDLWHQKSRNKWIQDGDRNTTFFHRSTIVRR